MVDVYLQIGFTAGTLAYLLTSEYSMNLEHDVEWAGDWELPDDWHARRAASWILEVYALVDVNGTVDSFINPSAAQWSGNYLPGTKSLRLLRQAGRVLKGAEHHAFFGIYTRLKSGVREVLTRLHAATHQQFHTFADRYIGAAVGSDRPSIWDPRGASHWETWIKRNPGAVEKIVGAMVDASYEYARRKGITGLGEAVEAALR